MGDNLEGQSLLALQMPEPFDTLRMYSAQNHPGEPVVVYDCYCNKQGTVSHIKTTVQSDSFTDALRMAHKRLLPMLNMWAFKLDVPVQASRVRIQERATGIVACDFLQVPYKRADLGSILGPAQEQVPESYHYLVFYYEALNSDSPFYQFLCFFKVIELVFALRATRAKEAKDKGATPGGSPAERLHEDDWLKKHLPENLLIRIQGKKFPAIRDDVLRPVRNSIAHAFLDDDGPTGRPAEELLDLDNVYQHLPLVKYMARQMVLNEMGDTSRTPPC